MPAISATQEAEIAGLLSDVSLGKNAYLKNN
jgi:hypothetical protein